MPGRRAIFLTVVPRGEFVPEHVSVVAALAALQFAVRLRRVDLVNIGRYDRVDYLMLSLDLDPGSVNRAIGD